MTLHPALSVHLSVGWLVGWLVGLSVLYSLTLLLLPKWFSALKNGPCLALCDYGSRVFRLLSAKRAIILMLAWETYSL